MGKKRREIVVRTYRRSISKIHTHLSNELHIHTVAALSISSSSLTNEKHAHLNYYTYLRNARIAGCV